MDFEFEIGIRRKWVFISCSFLTRLATVFIGRQEGGHSHITTDAKKFLLGHNFLFLMGEDSILLGKPWVAGLGAVPLLNWHV